MENLAVLPRLDSRERGPQVQLLLADDDADMRSLLVASARDRITSLAALEAQDGAEAVQIGLQQRPQIALLDVTMPKLGGIEAALTLRALHPQMRLALHTADPRTHRERARAHRLPLFDKLQFERALSWLELQVQSCVVEVRPRLLENRPLECSSCGYGIACSTPPARCPMCQAEGAWIHASRLPFHRGVESVL
jgi:CheY-like chemotaxis protein